MVWFFFLICDCSLVLPTAQLVSASYYLVNVLSPQVPAPYSGFSVVLFLFFPQGVQYTLSLLVAQICDRK